MPSKHTRALGIPCKPKPPFFILIIEGIQIDTHNMNLSIPSYAAGFAARFHEVISHP